MLLNHDAIEFPQSIKIQMSCGKTAQGVFLDQMAKRTMKNIRKRGHLAGNYEHIAGFCKSTNLEEITSLGFCGKGSQ